MSQIKTTLGETGYSLVSSLKRHLMNDLPFLTNPTRFLFFAGKGGVGKTSLSCAVAIALADAGQKVLLVSTDPASNLDEMLSVELSGHPRSVPEVRNLWALNIDPDAASEAYRLRVLNQLGPAADEAERVTVREQLSGACTTEIAAFDEFVDLLGEGSAGYDQVIFDTAPTGYTLRLLSLPKAWTAFLEANERGASCLGPHSGLKMQESRFRAALTTPLTRLQDPDYNQLHSRRGQPRSLETNCRWWAHF